MMGAEVEAGPIERGAQVRDAAVVHVRGEMPLAPAFT
jgi:hypothetical protein